jgi:regulator of protease activity HflC (stomatin/prohibitin superfamily)
MISSENLLLFLVILTLQGSTFILALIYFRRGSAPLRLTIMVAATVVLALIGWRWSRWLGVLLLPLLVHLFFWASLGLVSQSLFPVINWEKRKGAVRTLASFIFDFHCPSYVVENGKASQRIAGWSMSRHGAGVIRVGVGNAIVMQTTTQFSRVLGPGVSFIRHLESIKTVVDLHSKTRLAQVKATTKDGVPVEAPVFCLFRIASSGLSKAPREDFAFPEDAIRRVIYRQDGIYEEDENYSWDNYVLQVVIARFQEIMTRFRLDQLFAPHDPDKVPRLMLASLLNTAVRNDLSKREIELIFAGFGTIEFPELVQEQRIASWKAEWLARAKSLQAAGAADAERLVQRARAVGQFDLIQGMINGLASAQGLSGIEPADLITWQLLNAMESMSADPLLQPLIPQETINALSSIRKWLETPSIHEPQISSEQ